MQAGYLLQVFLRHTFDTCIRRVGNQEQIGLFEPVVEGSADECQADEHRLRQEEESYAQNSCARKEQMGDNTRTDFQELRHFQEISEKSRK